MDYLRDKTILITGGTGSFGKHFVRRVLSDHNPKAMRVFSRDELKQYEMANQFKDDRVRYLIGDVRDEDRLALAMKGADIVIHAAALKQVPACEYNPFEAIKTNILGSQNVATAALRTNVEKVVALSTDKAVSPANLYGATKLCAEKVIIAANNYRGESHTKLSCVRYGNVVGSRGSVVELFKRQAASGVLTITDLKMTRFWISLDQAVDLVMLALNRMSGGEIYIPKLSSMRVEDLAKAIAPEAEIHITGIRPGEKIHEELLMADEVRHTIEYDDHYLLTPEHFDWETPLPPGGTPVPRDWVYTSDRNTRWIEGETLLTMITPQARSLVGH